MVRLQAVTPQCLFIFHFQTGACEVVLQQQGSNWLNWASGFSRWPSLMVERQAEGLPSPCRQPSSYVHRKKNDHPGADKGLCVSRRKKNIYFFSYFIHSRLQWADLSKNAQKQNTMLFVTFCKSNVINVNTLDICELSLNISLMDFCFIKSTLFILCLERDLQCWWF